MVRTAILTLALALAAGSASAQGALQFEGFYGGVQLGYFEPEIDGVPIGDGTSTALVGGYNAAVGPNAIVGLEAMIGTPLATSVGPGMDFELQDMIQFRARAGFVTGDVLFYGALGYLDDSLAASTLSDDLNADGWTYAIGTEWMFAEDWSARLEIMNADLQVEGGHSYQFDSVQVGVLFHF